MISARTTRICTIGDKDYAKHDPIPVPADQFKDLGPDGIGFVERMPAEKKPDPKADAKPA